MSDVALTNPVNGTVADATMIDNNNDALETVINGGLDNGNVAAGADIDVDKLDAGVDNTILTSVAGVPTWEPPLLARVFFQANVSITATTEGTANGIVDSGAFAYENRPVKIEFFAPAFNSSVDGTLLHIVLFDGASSLGDIAQSASVNRVPCSAVFHDTPTAAVHQYIVKAYIASGTGTVRAGVGGAGNLVKGFIRVVHDS